MTRRALLALALVGLPFAGACPELRPIPVRAAAPVGLVGTCPPGLLVVVFFYDRSSGALKRVLPTREIEPGRYFVETGTLEPGVYTFAFETDNGAKCQGIMDESGVRVPV